MAGKQNTGFGFTYSTDGEEWADVYNTREIALDVARKEAPGKAVRTAVATWADWRFDTLDLEDELYEAILEGMNPPFGEDTEVIYDDKALNKVITDWLQANAAVNWYEVSQIGTHEPETAQ